MQDFLPALVFIGVYLITRLFFDTSIAMYAATAALMLAVAAQIIWQRIQKRPIGKRLWLTAIVIWVLGSITLILRDPMFVQMKPTILNIVIAFVFLGSQWVGRQNLTKMMLHTVFTMPDYLWTRLNWSWALFFLIEGAINAWVALHYSKDFWVAFKLWGLMGMTFVFLMLQFILLRRYLALDKSTD